MTGKRELRKSMLSLRGSLSSQHRKEWSSRIIDHFLAWETYSQSKVIAMYLPFGDEADISPLVEHAHLAGKTVVIPKVYKVVKRMEFYQFTGWGNLMAGPYGIREPDPLRAPLVMSRDLELIITPGVAFDRRGGRLGYGGGYYDRYFARMESESERDGALPPRVGVGFDMQIVERVPTDQFDFLLTHLVTENGIVSF